MNVMRFRTEIEIRPSDWGISHTTPVVMLGSCFTDEVGARLEADGFDVLRNPFGPLYNPLSLVRCLTRATALDSYGIEDLVEGPRGFHCLDYASRYSGPDADALLREINATQKSLHDALLRKPVVVLTLGSAFVYAMVENGRVVGNCHKFPADRFARRLASVEELCAALDGAARSLVELGVEHIIVTVSPIRHLADGLHGNTLSKSTLQLASAMLEERCGGVAAYFPSYEIMLDDLRDYRFYASDMKHPSEVAVDYIYEKFSDTFFSRQTRAEAIEARKRHLAACHRQIL